MIAWTAAALIFIAISSAAGVLLACWVGALTPEVAAVSFFLAFAAAVMTGWYCRRLRSEEPRPGWFDKAALFFFFLFCARNFLWIYYHSGQNVFTLNGYPYADLHFHLAFIKNFVSDTSFWPENPLFTGALLRYHFGMDLFTAMVVKLGLPLTRSLPLIGFFCGLLVLFALYLWGRGFTVAAFLFTGGMAGYVCLLNGIFDDYQAQLAWKNMALTTLLPQRGFLFAFPAGLLVLWSWRRRLLEDRPGLPPVIEGFLWGIMPFFQMHTFIFLSSIFGLWTISARKIREMLPCYFTALIPAVPLVVMLTNNFQKASMIWFKPGWMMEDQNPVIFFMLNFGLFCPLVFWVLCDLVKAEDRNDRLMFIPGFVWLTVLMFVMFGPWEWDNTKLIIWAYLLMLPVLDRRVIRKLPFAWRALLIAGLFVSGFSSVVSSMDGRNRGVPLIERETLDRVCSVVEKMAPETRFASSQEGYHPVLLCGRKLVAGFPGNLRAAFGLDHEPVEMRLRRLMMGEFDWEAMARELDAGYLYWGPMEERAYPGSNKPWEAASLKIAEGKWGAIYDLRKPAAWRYPDPPQVLPEGQGLQVSYFDNAEWQGQPRETRILPGPFLDWDDRTRPVSAPAGAVFEGELYAPDAGVYKFRIASDDGSEFEIDGKTLIENSGVHAVRARGADIRLEKGWHAIRIRYQDIGGGGTLRFWWQPAGGEEQIVPWEYFRVSERKQS